VDEGRTLIRRQIDVARVEVEVRLRIHRELGEEVLRSWYTPPNQSAQVTAETPCTASNRSR